MVEDYVTIQCGLRQLCPDKTVQGVHFPAVSAALAVLEVEANFVQAIAARPVKLLIKGFKRFYDKVKPGSGRVKMPFGMDLALKSRGVMRRQRFFEDGSMQDVFGSIQRQRAFTAMAVGIQCLLRRSEHLYSKDGTATPLRREHVTFFAHGGSVIDYGAVGCGVPAASVMINIEFAKTDASGFGRRTLHTRQSHAPDACLVTILESWVSTTRDSFGAAETDRLYHIPGFRDLSMTALHRAMQATVETLDIPGYTGHLTSHSLRYGGATMLAAAGFPQYLIAHYGGWTETSTALKIYTRPSEEMAQRVSESMVALARSGTSSTFAKDACARARTSAVDESTK